MNTLAIRACTLTAIIGLALPTISCGAFFVSEKAVTSIAITPTNAVAQIGATEQYVATGTRGDGTTLDVTPGATWTSSKPTVATLDSNGLATTVAIGTTKISCQYEQGSAETFLTVTSATLYSITVTPANASIASGATQQYVATGTYSDSSTRNITASVTWTSNYTTVATINAAGLATAVGGGSTSIAATSGTVSGSTLLTVTN